MDDDARAGSKQEADSAKFGRSEKHGNDTICALVPVRDTPKAAQLKAIEKGQREITGLLQILQNHQLGVFIAYVPMNKDCAAQKSACDRNCDTLQAFSR